MVSGASIREFRDKTSREVISPEELRSPKTRLGYAHWCSLRGQRRFPSREDIVARDIAGALTNMVLIKVIGGGEDFQFRIIGDHASRGFRFKLDNRLLTDIAPEAPKATANWFATFRQIVDQRAPITLHTIAGRDAGMEVNFIEAEAVFLPLGRSDDQVEYVLTFVHHTLRGGE